MLTILGQRIAVEQCHLYLERRFKRKNYSGFNCSSIRFIAIKRLFPFGRQCYGGALH